MLKKYIPFNTKLALKMLIGINKGRYITVFPDDIFIVSYPKSGNTWLRFLIGYLVYGDSLKGFSDINDKIPDIYKKTNRELIRIPRNRILKSHEYFDSRYKKVIYIVRDPRDVVVSYYHYYQKINHIPQDYSIETFISRFIAGDLNSFGNWEENVGSWLGARKYTMNFLLLHYEELLENTERELVRVSNFLNINDSNEKLIKAIKFASIKNMRQLEKQQAELWEETKHSRKDKFFIRSGSSGEWKKELPTLSIKDIELAWGKTMNQLGYN